MAPLVAGDFVEYSGIQANGEVIVYNLVVSNVQITTVGLPTYIRMEDANIGVWTADTANQEIAQTRVGPPFSPFSLIIVETPGF